MHDLVLTFTRGSKRFRVVATYDDKRVAITVNGKRAGSTWIADSSGMLEDVDDLDLSDAEVRAVENRLGAALARAGW